MSWFFISSVCPKPHLDKTNWSFLVVYNMLFNLICKFLDLLVRDCFYFAVSLQFSYVWRPKYCSSCTTIFFSSFFFFFRFFRKNQNYRIFFFGFSKLSKYWFFFFCWYDLADFFLWQLHLTTKGLRSNFWPFKASFSGSIAPFTLFKSISDTMFENSTMACAPMFENSWPLKAMGL